jgi:hypothetical protein
MARRQSGEVQFGSDSFLDVVCNIVGILIILIVIAGVRVSRAPLLTLRTTVTNEPSAVAAAEPALPADVEPDLEPASAPVAAIVDDTIELQQQIANLQQDQQSLVEQLQQGRSRLTAALEDQTVLNERLADVQSAVTRAQGNLTASEQAVASTKAELGTLKQLAAQLAAQVRTAQLEPDKVQRIEHRITPVGRTVTGDELHFRVEHNRVSVVPLEALLGRLKEQIERRKDMFAKARQHEGQVGPIDGYTLRYLVQRDNLSVVDELRYGAGMYRISVAHWQLDIDRSLPAETVEQALRPGSRFSQALLEAKSESALTFWVYPDSFEAYGQLKTVCHDQNFLVAGRPLPDGIPIAGSPNGTRSSGQ